MHEQVLNYILSAARRDEAQSWTCDADGRYTRDPEWQSKTAFSSHEYFMTNPSLSGRGQNVSDLPLALDDVVGR